MAEATDNMEQNTGYEVPAKSNTDNSIDSTESNNAPKESSIVEKVLNIFRKEWNKQVILYGPPGTSKTYSAVEIAARFLFEKYKSDHDQNEPVTHNDCVEYLKTMQDKGKYKIIQFHPSYSYEDFVRGITVKTEAGKMPTYVVEPKIIEKFCKGMSTNSNDSIDYRVLVIDEINRAPLASVLGELIYGLEYREEEIYTPYELKDENDSEKSKPLVIPQNLYIIGTMNTADRSIGSMDYAVRRRFAFVAADSKLTKAALESTWNSDVKDIACDLYKELLTSQENIFAPDFLTDRELDIDDIKIGHTYFLGDGKDDESNKEHDLSYLKYRIEYQIYPIYKEYYKDGLVNEKGINRFKEILRKIGDLKDLADRLN